jgi:uncharacterized membrane protein
MNKELKGFITLMLIVFAIWLFVGMSIIMHRKSKDDVWIPKTIVSHARPGYSYI